MKLNHFLLVTLAINFISPFGVAASDSLKMYLCTDQEDSAALKTVYGYIDGKKTSCMSEYDLRVAISHARLQRERKLRTPEQWQKAVSHGEKNLAGANLNGCDLKDADLSGADLTNAQLASADLRGANLKEAILIGANLKNTYCKRTDFRGADLSGATIQGTYFHYANLTDTKGLSPEELPNVATLHKALLEKTVLATVKKECPEKLKNPKNNWKRVILENEKDVHSSGEADSSTRK